MIKKLILSIFLFFVSIFAFSTITFATDPAAGRPGSEFATSYDVIYDVGLDGVTTVTEKITLKNLTSEYFAKQFKLTIGATDLSDIKAVDGGGPLQINSEKKDTQTTIEVKFNQQIVGKSKQLDWTLQFKSKDFAEKIGKIWDIRAPKVTPSATLESYNLTISVPAAFGEPTLISPTPKSQTQSFGKMLLTFDKSQLLNSGVSASFGANQVFDFDLSYHLENTNLVPIITTIALPPDTAYQDVIFQRIDPNPMNVTVDNDGNYLAWYKLNRNEKKDIKVSGSAKLYSASKVKSPNLSENLKKKYTSTDKYWEVNHPNIQAKLNEILGQTAVVSTLDNFQKTKLIYRYVVDYLKYNSSRLTNSETGVERLGAVTALNNQASAVCMEFTDLFIVLARAANIPARELNGYAYSKNTTLRPLSLGKDILHSWPEYWDDKKGWVMVDPTWENTTGGVDYFNKLDLNHFVFVTKGSSSIQPIPAGSYKYKNTSSNDIKVTLSENDFLGKANLDIRIDNADPILAGFQGRIKVEISNMGNSVFPSANFSVTAGQLKILESNSLHLGPIPAFGKAIFNLNTRTMTLFDSFNDTIVITIGSQKFVKDVTVKPFILFRTNPILAALIIFLMVFVYIIVLTGLLYRRKILKVKRKK